MSTLAHLMGRFAARTQISSTYQLHKPQHLIIQRFIPASVPRTRSSCLIQAFTRQYHISNNPVTKALSTPRFALTGTPKTPFLKSSAFRPSRITRDWHQKVDHKLGGFYYENIFTGERTRIQPREFLPFDHVAESAAVAMIRNDGLSPGQKKASKVRTIIKVLILAATLYTLDHFGILQGWLGLTPPPRPEINMDERVVAKTKEKVKQFTDFSQGKIPI